MRTLKAPRLVAIQPMSMLCIYWSFGEPALVITAFLVPFLAFAFNRPAPRDQPASNVQSTSRLLSRDELMNWLNRPNPQAGPGNSPS